MSNELSYKGKTYGYNDDGERADKLISASAYIGDSLPAVTLSVDTLNAVVTDHDAEPRVLTLDGVPLVDASGTLMVAPRTGVTLDKAAKYGDEVVYDHNGKQVGKFRLESIKRIGRETFQLSCVSDIGLLLTEDHYGGLYAGETVAAVVKDVIGGIVPYTIDAAFGSVPVYGLLRKRSRRDNLRDILFAYGGQIRKDAAGQIVIGPMPEAAPYEITADEFYMGGSVTGGNPATGIDLTEHSFLALPNDPVVTLYDGAAYAAGLVTPKGKSVTGVLVDFKEPMYDLSIENAEILESGVNYAVITGSPAAVLTGRQYTHTERVISRRFGTGGTPNVIPSRACELVNLLNSELVADRLQAYYGSGKTVEAEFVVDGQKPGDAVTFTDPFGDATEGYIADMELTMSAIVKAKATLVSGFFPVGSGNYYSNVMTVTESQTVTIPAEAKSKALLVLISGGDGGMMGSDGEAGGWDATSSSYGTPGAGGLPGAPGAGGRIAVFTIPVKAGQTFTAKIGAGGKGQTSDAAAGKGGATTFGPYSSDVGFSSPDGYVDPITKEAYGLPGEEGLAGGSGAGKGNTSGGEVTYKGVTYKAGAAGVTDDTARGGAGGGPAAGAHGGAGKDGDMYRVSSGTYQAQGGSGGEGATPVKADSGAIPGQGGQGGHGGGGGGGGGPASGGDKSPDPGIGGSGGSGGEGGDGAPGIAILFY